jgi:hypothetical protein
MRLRKLETGHPLKIKLMLRLRKLLSGSEPPDVVKLLMYRPEHFGRPFSELLQSALRAPSQWTVGERELFAAFTSRLNECRF